MDEKHPIPEAAAAAGPSARTHAIGRPHLPAPLRRWLRRYGPAEFAGTGMALIGAAVAAPAGDLWAGVIATWAENAGFYGVLAVAEVRGRLGNDRPRTPLAAAGAVCRALGGLVLEFGPAEALDSLLVRPALLALGLRLAPSPVLGIVAGKLAADLIFYVPTILIFEWRRRIWRRGDAELPGISDGRWRPSSMGAIKPGGRP